ncbi:FAD-dependent oxidoreductase [Sneathiella sp. P13V-1]|uniref:NAD(P)/FAD-dependent oxidoreductase n=1 Tax=Sneathiella sp. P13V-1 TaxID=2697366 RepID=UPI00187B1B78|nr:FAD-binding oxidoreductase [Sneathiella sp. P13V-1]MBE7637781.1 FAD-dependent oxidoreductase [Sneathiella sp. P13V-1]
MSTAADVIVIGGGMAGISAAAEIALDAKVIVLEAEKTIGYHASGRTAAIFIRNYGNDTLRALNAISEDFFLNPEGVAETSLLTPRGQLIFAHESELNALNTYLQGAEGMEVLTSKEAGELVPILKTDLIVKAAYEKTAQDIDVDRMLQGYQRLLKSRQGTVITGAPVTEMKHEAGAWYIEAGGEHYQANVIVNAAGAWVDEIANKANVPPVGANPLRRSAAILPRPEIDGFDKWPLFVSASESFYAKPEAGTLMVSPADEDSVEPHDAWPDDMVLAEGLYRFEEATTMDVTRLEHSWAGLRTFVQDKTPVVGYAPDAEGFFWLAGQGGYGIQTAPALSKLTADLIAGRKPKIEADVLAALAPERLFR